METAGCAIWQGWQSGTLVVRVGVVGMLPPLKVQWGEYCTCTPPYGRVALLTLRPRGHGSELVLSEVRPRGLGVKLVLG